jgi:hypothetical protein
MEVQRIAQLNRAMTIRAVCSLPLFLNTQFVKLTFIVSAFASRLGGVAYRRNPRD